MPTPRAARPDERERHVPLYAVWEVTLACDQACAHCGSRAARARPRELTTDELLRVADQLAAAGTREVTLIGGEAYLRPDLPRLVRRLVDHGLRVTMQSGGRGLTRDRMAALADAGMFAVGISIDGPEPVHDELRAVKGSYRAALAAVAVVREAGLPCTSNLQVNRLNLPHLRSHFDVLHEAGIRAWRLQLTVPMGRAADRPEWILRPWEILEALDTAAALQVEALRRAEREGISPRRAMNVLLGNNLGYYGPWEELLRTRPGDATSAYWGGCPAGWHTVSIESDGSVKGCPSLPSAPYVGGNVLHDDFATLWSDDAVIGFTRKRGTSELWGFCKTCYYADECRGGCAWTAHTVLGRRGNNPFCYHRAATLKADGVRERLVPVEAAPGRPYDFGRFEIVTEPWEEDYSGRSGTP